MNDTCTAHRSRVPRRSFGRVKWGVTTVEDERGPGLDFSLCFVCGSRPWGAAAFLLCLFILLLNVFEWSPVPASFFPYISTSLHWCRNPGGRRDTLSESPRCWGGSQCWGDRAAGSSGDRQWLPEAVVLEQKKNRWDGRLAAVLLGRGGVAAVREGAEESPRSPGGRSLLPSAMFGEEQGTGDSLPAALDRRSHRRPPGGRGASGRPPKMSSTIAWHREWTAQLVEDREAVCPGTGPRFFFFLSLVSVTPHPSVSFSLASSVLTPRYAAAALKGSPRERGEGGSRAQSRGYPPACEGRWGYVASGAGPRAVGTERGRWSNW